MDQVAHMFDVKNERAVSNQLRVDALARNPHHPALNNNLAYNWALQGVNLDKALEMSVVALEGDPDVSAYLDTKGWILYKLGRFDEAVEYLKRAKETGNSDSSVVVDHLGDALWRIGQKQQAIQTWKQAQTVRNNERQQNQQLLNAPTPVVPRWVFDHSADLELRDIDARLQSKIKAAQSNAEPAVAPVVVQEAAQKGK
jgi:tetratricopeptide (TPR) repeat protein